MPDTPIEVIDYVKTYNDLVAEAKALGLEKKRVNGFANEAEAESECEALAEEVEALRSGAKPKSKKRSTSTSKSTDLPFTEPDDPASRKKEKTMAKTETEAKKTTKPAAKGGTTKPAAKGSKAPPAAKAERKAAGSGRAPAAAKAARKPVAAVDAPSGKVAGTLFENLVGTRVATKRAVAVRLLVDNLGKPVGKDKLVKAMGYADGQDSAFQSVIVGIQATCDDKELGYAIVRDKDEKGNPTLTLKKS